MLGAALPSLHLKQVSLCPPMDECAISMSHAYLLVLSHVIWSSNMALRCGFFVATTTDVDRVAFIAFSLSQLPVASSHSSVNSLPFLFVGSSAADLAAPEKMAKFEHANPLLAARMAERQRDISRIIASPPAAIPYSHTVSSSIQPLLQEVPSLEYLLRLSRRQKNLTKIARDRLWQRGKGATKPRRSTGGRRREGGRPG